MITEKQAQEAKARAVEMLKGAGIVLTPKDMEHLEPADFGLGELEKIGLVVMTYVNNARYCAKDLVMFPRQTCPEHRHPPIGDDPGKLETLRCRQGLVWLYVEGEPTPDIEAHLPAGHEKHFSIFHQITLNPGDQHTFPSNTLHWFQAGDEGAVVASFSSTSRDTGDIFTHPGIVRETSITKD